jgi:hypothetical protein
MNKLVVRFTVIPFDEEERSLTSPNGASGQSSTNSAQAPADRRPVKKNPRDRAGVAAPASQVSFRSQEFVGPDTEARNNCVRQAKQRAVTASNAE